MAANLNLVLAAVIALFTVFSAALAYAQWSTRGMDVYRAER